MMKSVQLIIPCTCQFKNAGKAGFLAFQEDHPDILAWGPTVLEASCLWALYYSIRTLSEAGIYAPDQIMVESDSPQTMEALKDASFDEVLAMIKEGSLMVVGVSNLTKQELPSG